MFCVEHLLILKYTTHTHTHTPSVFSTHYWQTRPAPRHGTWAVVQGCTLRRAPQLVWCSVTILKRLIIFEQGIMRFHFRLSPASSTAGPVLPASMAGQYLAGGREETFRAGSSTLGAVSSMFTAGSSTLELELLSFFRKVNKCHPIHSWNTRGNLLRFRISVFVLCWKFRRLSGFELKGI